MGTVPGDGALKGLPTFSEKDGAEKKKTGESSLQHKDDDPTTAKVAQQANTLMSLLNANAEWNTPSKTSRVWLGEGLGSIPKRVHDRMLRWEYVDMADFLPRSALDRSTSELETEKLVVLPGFEVSQTRKKPVANIVMWVQCFAKYTAAMAKHFPDCTPGFMSHMLTVMKAFSEVEEPAWRLYDEAYREKMASTGNRAWLGMDVALYQELCGSRPRRKLVEPAVDSKGPSRSLGKKRPSGGQKSLVCWQFNDGDCSFGKACKFPHVCEVCRGNHPKYRCTGSNIASPSSVNPGSDTRY